MQIRNAHHLPQLNLMFDRCNLLVCDVFHILNKDLSQECSNSQGRLSPHHNYLSTFWTFNLIFRSRSFKFPPTKTRKKDFFVFNAQKWYR